MSIGGDHEANKSYQQDLIESLRDPREAEEYLNAALEEDDPELFLLALRNVAEVNSSLRKLPAKDLVPSWARTSLMLVKPAIRS